MRRVINPLVDYSKDFVGNFDPNVLPAAFVAFVESHPDRDMRDHQWLAAAMNEQRELELEDLEGVEPIDGALRELEGTDGAVNNGEADGRRFAVVGDIGVLNQSVRPRGTVNRNKWALRTFQEWITARGSTVAVKPITEFTIEEINTTLGRFIHEVRKVNGDRYPGGSLVSIAAGLQAVIREANPTVDLFKSAELRPFRDSLDAAMKLSTAAGSSLNAKPAGILCVSDEEKIWQSGVLGVDDPVRLTKTLFFLNGLHFALRGGVEHAGMLLTQLQVAVRENEECLVYKEATSKTNQGGLNDKRHKLVDRVYVPTEGNRICHLTAFKKFLKVRPSGVERFYLQPAKNWESNTVWFTSRPIGKNQLCKMMADITTDAGVPKLTNHSLRATCATRLYQAGVDEQIIMERTGHRSVEGVRAYKRTSMNLIKTSSLVVDGKVVPEVASDSRCGGHTFVFNNCTVVQNIGPTNVGVSPDGPV